MRIITTIYSTSNQFEITVAREILKNMLDLVASHVLLSRAAKNMETFSFAAAHDLKSPLRHIKFVLDTISEDSGEEDPAFIKDLINKDWDLYVSPDRSFMIFKSNRPGGLGDMDLYISYKGEDGAWRAAKNMGPAINTSDHDDAGDLSPDGRFLFFTRRIGDLEMDIYWVDGRIIQALRLEE